MNKLYTLSVYRSLGNVEGVGTNPANSDYYEDSNPVYDLEYNKNLLSLLPIEICGIKEFKTKTKIYTNSLNLSVTNKYLGLTPLYKYTDYVDLEKAVEILKYNLIVDFLIEADKLYFNSNKLYLESEDKVDILTVQDVLKLSDISNYVNKLKDRFEIVLPKKTSTEKWTVVKNAESLIEPVLLSTGQLEFFPCIFKINGLTKELLTHSFDILDKEEYQKTYNFDYSNLKSKTTSITSVEESDGYTVTRYKSYHSNLLIDLYSVRYIYLQKNPASDKKVEFLKVSYNELEDPQLELLCQVIKTIEKTFTPNTFKRGPLNKLTKNIYIESSSVKKDPYAKKIGYTYLQYNPKEVVNKRSVYLAKKLSNSTIYQEETVPDTSTLSVVTRDTSTLNSTFIANLVNSSKSTSTTGYFHYIEAE